MRREDSHHLSLGRQLVGIEDTDRSAKEARAQALHEREKLAVGMAGGGDGRGEGQGVSKGPILADAALASACPRRDRQRQRNEEERAAPARVFPQLSDERLKGAEIEAG